jgi:hypothetical protein
VSDDWEMPRRGEACAMCRHSFEPGETIHACLYESPAGYERRDYCTNCQPPDKPFAIGSWKTRRPEPATKKTQAFDRETIYGLFERLEDADTPQQQQLRFVLALLLWRKKVLKFDRSETREDGEVWHFVVPRTDDAHSVQRPDLDEEQLDRLGTQLEVLLAGEVESLDSVPSGLDQDEHDD